MYKIAVLISIITVTALSVYYMKQSNDEDHPNGPTMRPYLPKRIIDHNELNTAFTKYLRSKYGMRTSVYYIDYKSKYSVFIEHDADYSIRLYGELSMNGGLPGLNRIKTGYRTYGMTNWDRFRFGGIDHKRISYEIDKLDVIINSFCENYYKDDEKIVESSNQSPK